jgi:hypothetical protein
MDLMYLSTLDLPGSLISESRTSAPSSSQVSWLYQHVLTLYTSSPRTYSPYTQTAHIHVHTLYTAIPRIHNQPTYAPYTQPTRIRVLTLYTDNPRTPQKIGFSVNLRISSVNPSCYLRRSPLHMYPQVFTRSFTQENRYTICTSVFL